MATNEIWIVHRELLYKTWRNQEETLDIALDVRFSINSLEFLKLHSWFTEFLE